MLSVSNTFLTRFLLKPIVIIGFLFSFSHVASAQVYYNDVFGKYPLINPLLSDAFKKPKNSKLLLSEYVKPSKHELMYWRNFPLTPAQLEARNREWDRKYNQSLGKQIANEIIETTFNKLIYGKKTPVVATPKF